MCNIFIVLWQKTKVTSKAQQVNIMKYNFQYMHVCTLRYFQSKDLILFA